MSLAIYCDMDGVLVDFEKGAKRVYPNFKGRKMSEKEERHFWELVAKKGISFWANLSWLDGGKFLWEYISDFKPYILSAYTQDKFASKEGKRLWVIRNISSNVQVILVKSEEKVRYAKPNAILIDDRKDLVDAWTTAGGIGILHKNLISTLSCLDNYIDFTKKCVSRRKDAEYLHAINTF